MHSSRLVVTLFLQNVLNVLVRFLEVLFGQQFARSDLGVIKDTQITELALVNLLGLLRWLRFSGGAKEPCALVLEGLVAAARAFF